MLLCACARLAALHTFACSVRQHQPLSTLFGSELIGNIPGNSVSTMEAVSQLSKRSHGSSCFSPTLKCMNLTCPNVSIIYHSTILWLVWVGISELSCHYRISDSEHSRISANYMTTTSEDRHILCLTIY